MRHVKHINVFNQLFIFIGVITVFLTSSILLLSRQVNSLIQQRHWRQGATNTIYEIQYKVPLESDLEGNWKVSLQFSKPVTMVGTFKISISFNFIIWYHHQDLRSNLFWHAPVFNAHF